MHPALAEVEAELAVAADCWERLKGAKTKYLPREVMEPKRAYDNRVNRATYPDFFRDAIVAFSGSLSRFEVTAAPPSLEKALGNIDGQGTSLKAFLMQTDQMVLRDNGVLLSVDMPTNRPEDRTTEKEMGRRPVLRMAERRNVLNWKMVEIGGRIVPYAVTIREYHEVDDGDYGTKIEPRYRVMVGDQWKVVVIKGGESGSKKAWKVETAIDASGEEMKGQFQDHAGQGMGIPPVIWYGATLEGFGKGSLPLQTLIDLSLKWYRNDSTLQELILKTGLPVGVYKGQRDESKGPLVIGPNNIVNITDPNGDFNWKEVNGSSIGKHQEEIKHIEELIDRKTLAFMSTDGPQRTAQEAMLETAQVQATLLGIGEAKASAMQSVMQLWSAFTGETLGQDAGIRMAKGLIDQPVTESTLQLAKELYDARLLRRESVTALEARAGMLPQGVKPEDEAAALAEEEAITKGVEGAVTPGASDLGNLDQLQ